MRRYFILFFFGIYPSVLAQSSDYLIVENPSQLRILNKFEQSLGQSESEKLYPFMPFEITAPRVLLSDHITTGIKVKSGPDIYFFLSDAYGNPVNILAAGAWKIYYAVRTFSDTITIASGDKLFVHRGIAPSQPHVRPLQKDEKAVRMFSWSGWTYVHSMIEHDAGWVELGIEGESWNKGRALKTQSAALSDVVTNIQTVINNTNSLLLNIYEALNRIEQRNETPPQWELKQEKNKIICLLTPANADGAFSESIDALKLECENALIGTPFKVLRRGSVIEIHAP